MTTRKPAILAAALLLALVFIIPTSCTIPVS